MAVPKDSADECSAFIGYFLTRTHARHCWHCAWECGGTSFKPWSDVFLEILLSPMLETGKLSFRFYLEILRPGFKGQLSWPSLTIWQPCLSTSVPVEEPRYPQRIMAKLMPAFFTFCQLILFWNLDTSIPMVPERTPELLKVYWMP